MLIWKDVSTRSSNCNGEVKSLNAMVGKIKLVVTRHIHYEPTDWVVSFGEVISQRKLSSGTLEEAKELAVSLVKTELNKMLEGLK